MELHRAGPSAAVVCLTVSALICGCADDAANSPDARPADGSSKEAATDLQADGVTPGCSVGCGSGQVCLAGKCVAVGPTKTCGATKYGVGLPSSGVVYVDGSYKGASKGTAAQPHTKISAALAAATPKLQVIAVAAGKYTEDLSITRNIRLACRCATKVTIAGSLTIKPPVQTPNLSVTLDGCRLRPPGTSGKPTSWSKCDANNNPRGVNVLGGVGSVALRIRDSEISGWCVGAWFNAASQPTSTSSLCLVRSLISANVKGLEVVQAPALNTTPFPECKGLSEAVAARLSLVAENKDYGVFTRLSARGLSMEANIIERSGKLGSATGGLGYGVYLGNTEAANFRSNRFSHNGNRGLGMKNLTSLLATAITIQDNQLTGNRGAGIALQQLQVAKPVAIRGNRVDGTVAVPGEPGGDGIQISVNKGKLYNVTVEQNNVRSSQRHGVFLEGVGGTVRSNVIGGNGKHGILLQQSKAAVGANSYSSNGASDVGKKPGPTEKYGDLPIPIP